MSCQRIICTTTGSSKIFIVSLYGSNSKQTDMSVFCPDGGDFVVGFGPPVPGLPVQMAVGQTPVTQTPPDTPPEVTPALTIQDPCVESKGSNAKQTFRISGPMYRTTNKAIQPSTRQSIG